MAEELKDINLIICKGIKLSCWGKKLKTPKILIKMAGAVGFEPTNADSKDPCLAAWRRPSIILLFLLG